MIKGKILWDCILKLFETKLVEFLQVNYEYTSTIIKLTKKDTYGN